MKEKKLILLFILAAACLSPCPAASQEDEICLSCHDDEELLNEAGDSMHVDPAGYAGSVHGQVGMECINCHQDLDGYEDWPHDEKLEKADCSFCHEEEHEEWIESVHGKASLEGSRDVPDCAHCHGTHEINAMDNPEENRVNRHMIASLCARCHEDESLSRKYGFQLGMLESYLDSYHGISFRFGGDSSAPTCASCHGFHDIRTSTDPESSIHPDNLAATCGSCHPDAGRKFSEGKIHLRGRIEDNLGAWLVKNLYIALIAVLTAGFLAYISLDLYDYRRRRKAGKTGGEKSPGEEESQ